MLKALTSNCKIRDTGFYLFLMQCWHMSIWTQVRSAFAKIIVIVAHVSLQDGPCPPPLIQGLYSK